MRPIEDNSRLMKERPLLFRTNILLYSEVLTLAEKVGIQKEIIVIGKRYSA